MCYDNTVCVCVMITWSVCDMKTLSVRDLIKPVFDKMTPVCFMTTATVGDIKISI